MRLEEKNKKMGEDFWHGILLWECCNKEGKDREMNIKKKTRWDDKMIGKHRKGHHGTYFCYKTL